MELKVKEVIKGKGLSMQEFADKLGITRDTLTRNINGNPTIETLDKIAKALDVEITELFETSGANKTIGIIRHGDKAYEINSIEDIEAMLEDIKRD